jgi:hypothetical protein
VTASENEFTVVSKNRVFFEAVVLSRPPQLVELNRAGRPLSLNRGERLAGGPATDQRRRPPSWPALEV